MTDLAPRIVESRHHGTLVNPNMRWSGRMARSVPRTVPTRAHRLVQVLLRCMIREKVTYQTVGERAGTSLFTIMHWRTGRYPDLREIEACLNVFGLEIGAIPVLKTKRQIARETGSKVYDGVPCRNCGNVVRYIANNHCIECLRIQRRKK